MSTFRTVEDIDAWRVGNELVEEIYRISGRGPFAKDYGLRDQIRKASVSIVSNIAEGFERDGRGELLQFLSIAKGSTGEVKTQLIVARNLGYIDVSSFERCRDLVTRTGQMLGGLMNYLRQKHMNGIKFKPFSNEERETIRWRC